MYKVLIIEDEYPIRKWLTYCFDYEALNCTVVGEADDGQDAIDKIKQLKPDIVVTDINLPIKNAFQIFEETKDILYAKLIISGYNDFVNAKNAMAYDAVDFIVKPIEEQQLIRGIERAIDTYETQKFYKEHRLSEDNLMLDVEPINLNDPLVKNMVTYLIENYHRKFTFNELADSLGYSSASLYKRFKDRTGQTFNDYLNKYRIREAIRMMREGEYKIYEISERTGFSEYPYFNKVFKKYTGYSARTFLQKMEK